MRKFFWVVSAISAVIGGLVLVGGIADATGAPQEAAAAAIAIAIGVLPYCFARALDEFSRSTTTTEASSPPIATLQCNACDRMYASTNVRCPGCGASRLDAMLVDSR